MQKHETLNSIFMICKTDPVWFFRTPMPAQHFHHCLLFAFCKFDYHKVQTVQHHCCYSGVVASHAPPSPCTLCLPNKGNQRDTRLLRPSGGRSNTFTDHHSPLFHHPFNICSLWQKCKNEWMLGYKGKGRTHLLSKLVEGVGSTFMNG